MSLPCFIDIETVPEIDLVKDNMPLEVIEIYKNKFRKPIIDEIGKTASTIGESFVAHYKENAALHAEFGKVVCVSIGGQHQSKYIIQSAVAKSEPALLKWVSDKLGTTENLCAHNGLEFDFPYLMRRMIINGITAPPGLNVGSKKPWDVKLEDTMKIWGGTSWNYKVSLQLLAYKLGIQSPKTDMSGADVPDLYYGIDWDNQEEVSSAVNKLGAYCSGDNLTTARCYIKMKGLGELKDYQVVQAPTVCLQ